MTAVPIRPRRAVLYGRVSKAAPGRSSREGGTTASVDQQLDALLAQAHREGVTVVGPFRDDGVSASRYANGKAREGWRQTMQAISSGEATELWAWEISRATRDRPVWAALIGACIASNVKISVGGRLHDPNDPDDGFMLDLQAALAVRESAQTSKRILRDVAARAAEGKPHGKIPYGYTREYDPRTRALLRQVPDPETAPILEEMARRILAGESMYAIAVDLNRRGIPAPEVVRARRMHGPDVAVDAVWRPDEVRDQVLSPTAAGLRTHKGVVVADATWPAIISPADQARLTALIRQPGRQQWWGPVKHLLSGIAECGVCAQASETGIGTPLRRLKNRGYDSYSCPGPDRRGTSCVTRLQKPLDKMVSTYVVALLMDPGLLQRAAQLKAGQVQRVLGEAEELANLQARKAEFEAAAKALGGAEAMAALPIIADYSRQIDEVKARMGRDSGLPQIVLDAAGPDAPQKWEDHDMLWRRQIVRSLVRVRVHRSTQRRGVREFDRSSIEIIRL